MMFRSPQERKIQCPLEYGMDTFGGKWKPRKKRSKTAAYCNEHPISNEARRRPDGYKAEHGIE